MEGTIVEKRYYNAESLERSLIVLKPIWAWLSEFYAAHQADDERVAMTPAAEQWVSFYREALELRGDDDFAGQVRRELEPA